VAVSSSSGPHSLGRAAIVSRHPATLKHVGQALAVARLSSRQAIGPSFLPRSTPGEFGVVLLDLDVDAATPPPELCAQVAAACEGTPIIVLAGLDARHRLIQALGHPAVTGAIPKLGAWSEGPDQEAKMEGPDEQDLGLALRRLMERASQPLGPMLYLLHGTAIEERIVGGTTDKEVTLAELLNDAARYGFSDEKMRRIETASDELMLNAIFDAPRDDAGRPLHAELDRRTPVKLGAQAQVRVRWGCDGRLFVVSVTDRFGALTRAAVAEHIHRLLGTRAPRSGREPGSGGAGLGLVLVYSAANQLVVHTAAGRFTEVTAVLHVAGSNRSAVARGSTLHIFD
jgi:hypothetical protein